MADTNNYTLITGATSGIGCELARLFAADHHNLVLVARNSLKLKNLADELHLKHGVAVYTITKDLFLVNSAGDIYNELKSKDIIIKTLINNAGQGAFGHFTEIELERLINIIQLNIITLTSLTHYFLKDMMASNEGHILNVGSIASKIPSPMGAVYSASKAYVLNLTEALISEVDHTNVKITLLLPGMTDTDFFNKAGSEQMEFASDKDSMLSAEQVAKAAYHGLLKGEHKVVPGLKNKMFEVLSNVIPDDFLADQLKRQSSKPKKNNTHR